MQSSRKVLISDSCNRSPGSYNPHIGWSSFKHSDGRSQKYRAGFLKETSRSNGFVYPTCAEFMSKICTAKSCAASIVSGELAEETTYICDSHSIELFDFSLSTSMTCFASLFQEISKLRRNSFSHFTRLWLRRTCRLFSLIGPLSISAFLFIWAGFQFSSKVVGNLLSVNCSSLVYIQAMSWLCLLLQLAALSEIWFDVLWFASQDYDSFLAEVFSAIVNVFESIR